MFDNENDFADKDFKSVYPATKEQFLELFAYVVIEYPVNVVTGTSARRSFYGFCV